MNYFSEITWWVRKHHRPGPSRLNRRHFRRPEVDPHKHRKSSPFAVTGNVSGAILLCGETNNWRVTMPETSEYYCRWKNRQLASSDSRPNVTHPLPATHAIHAAAKKQLQLLLMTLQLLPNILQLLILPLFQYCIIDFILECYTGIDFI